MRLSFKTLFLSILEVLARVQGPGDSYAARGGVGTVDQAIWPDLVQLKVHKPSVSAIPFVTIELSQTCAYRGLHHTLEITKNVHCSGKG